MSPHRAQQLVRELITGTDSLSRVWYEANDATGSARLAALRSTLQRIDCRLGGDTALFALQGELDLVYQRLRDLASRTVNPPGRRELDRLLARAATLRLRAPRIGGSAVALTRSGSLQSLPVRRRRRGTGDAAPGSSWKGRVALGLLAALGGIAAALVRRGWAACS